MDPNPGAEADDLLQFSMFSEKKLNTEVLCGPQNGYEGVDKGSMYVIEHHEDIFS